MAIESSITIPIDKGWQPDIAGFKMPPGGLLQAKNLVPYDKAYKPARQKVPMSTNTKTGIVRAIREFKDNLDIHRIFLGATDKLFRLEGNNSLADVTKVGASYNTGDNTWNFEDFGQWIIATNFTYAPQVLKGMSAANFVDLGGNPPKAKFCLLHSGHLIFAFTNDSTINPKKLTWSASEDVEDYVASVTTGADSQVLADSQGEITGLAGLGELIVIFHEDSITLGYYSGGRYTFSFAQNKFRNIGCISYGSIVSIGDGIIFWSKDNICLWRMGGSPEPIGEGVREALFANLNLAYAFRISGAYDSANGIIYWAYPSTASATGNPDRLLVLNTRKSRFTDVHLDVECLGGIHFGAKDMDNIDSIFPNLDAVPYGMDSQYWLANFPVIACVDPDTDKVATMTGFALSGTLETGDYNADKKIIEVQSIAPGIDTPTSTVSARVGSRLYKNDAVSYTSPSDMQSDGCAYLRSTGRYNRVELTTGEHNGLYDIEADVVERGER